ncbi:CCAAT-binding factor domain containing protein [Aphelenchoides fujianensis]|nr:CCAAT-binding factor domain containing protein [Aphelenchoides fujianensis]
MAPSKSAAPAAPKRMPTEEKRVVNEWIAKFEGDPEKLDHRMVNEFVKRHMGDFEAPELFAGSLLRILKAGGLAAIPAFEGLLFLVLGRNFALDDLYQEAYNLLKPSICFSPHGQQLLELVDRALSSPYIPKYMLAAFAKRLARLLLWAPAAAQQTISVVLKNMFVSHEGVFEPLVNRKEPSTMAADPFDNEAKLADCRAADSSLWELKALANHWHIGVADRSKFIFGGKPDQRVPVRAVDPIAEIKRKAKMEKSSINTTLVKKRLAATAELIVD